MTDRTQGKSARLRPEVRAYLAADNSARLAAQARDKAFLAAFPRGTEVTWMHGEFRQWGEVVAHGFKRVQVLNRRSGREVWLDQTRIDI